MSTHMVEQALKHACPHVTWSVIKNDNAPIYDVVFWLGEVTRDTVVFRAQSIDYEKIAQSRDSAMLHKSILAPALALNAIVEAAEARARVRGFEEGKAFVRSELAATIKPITDAFAEAMKNVKAP